MSREWLHYYTQMAGFAFAWYSFAMVAGTVVKESVSNVLAESNVITLIERR